MITHSSTTDRTLYPVFLLQPQLTLQYTCKCHIKYTPRYSLREMQGACFSGGESSSQTSSADLDARWALELRHFCRIWMQSGLKGKQKTERWISGTDRKQMHSLHYYAPANGAPVRLDTAWLNLKYTSNGLRKKYIQSFSTSVLKVGCSGQWLGVTVLHSWARCLINLMVPHSNHVYIPLTNRIRGPYRKLRTQFFPPRFMAQAKRMAAINRRGKIEDP